MKQSLSQQILNFLVVLSLPTMVSAADWPQWRYDANRSGASPAELPAKLYPEWVRENSPLIPAWPDQAKMQFDIVREPVVKGRMMYINSSRHDCIRALDTRTGEEKWRFYADGPVRFAPVLWEDKVIFAADDGYLYCLNSTDGAVAWKFRGGPNDRRILGNDRLISTWPARGAPVVMEDKVYFAASIWPFMGIFIHALDAKTGQPIWTNDGDGSVYMKQPHNTDSFAGVAPQGALVAVGDKLLIPGGRSIPACYDRLTGKMLRYQLAENSKRGGGSEVSAIADVFFNGGGVFELKTEKYLAEVGKQVAFTENHVFAYDKGTCKIYDLSKRKTQQAEVVDPKDKKKKTKVTRWSMPELASLKLSGMETMIQAGSRVYLGGQDQIVVLDWNAEAKTLRPSWTIQVKGEIVRLVAADDRLFAVTRQGAIHSFSGAEAKPIVHAKTKGELPNSAADVQAKAKQILAACKSDSGYAVVWGAGDGSLVEELARQSRLHILVVEADAKKVRALRDRWTNADLYGTRIAVLAGDSVTAQLPPYLASVMVCDNPDLIDAGLIAAGYHSLRPYGGCFCLFAGEKSEKLLATVSEQQLVAAKSMVSDGMVTVTRAGALPGSANWTHEHADPSNTRVSKDSLVKAPLGVLWFGGPTHDGILPRHGHGPQPQVIDGRMIIEGVDLMRAIDIYTGRLLWETRLPGVGSFYNNLAHQAGANGAGSNFVSTSDGIYVVLGNTCVRLDPATGKKLNVFPMPKLGAKNTSPRWGYVNIVGDYLIGGADPIFDPKTMPPPPKLGESGDDKEPAATKAVDPKEPVKKDDAKKESALAKLLRKVKGFTDNYTSSRHLVVMDRHTGKVLWTATAQYGFRHNATCAGGGRLFTIDRLSGQQLASLKSKDKQPPVPPRLIAFDLDTGKEIWSTQADVFGTWLSYSEKHDILLEAGRVARDSLYDEPKGMRAYHGKVGKIVWFEKAYSGPAMIHGETVLQGQEACDLLTGALKMRIDPITGASVPWKWIRNYGCNTPAASEHLLTFRSGAAGYFDYCNDGGTGNFGGFRSSCTNNLIVAGGLLTAPEYTRTCSCAYQNQSSIALIHMPEAEMWTSFGSKDVKGVVQRLGLNLGAPGDRKAEDGTLWLEYPSVGGTSPVVPITLKPASPEIFRRHPSTVQGVYDWVASSGAKNISDVAVTLGKMDQPAVYTVRLYFAEPDNVSPGERLFDVFLQGKKVLTNFDVAKEAGGARRSLIKEFKGVSAQGQLVLRLVPAGSATVRAPILSGIELIAEERK